MLIGSHQSISKSIDLSIQRALADGCECLQIFVKNNNRWAGRELGEDEAERFKNAVSSSSLRVCAHSCYLINPASFDDDIHAKTVSCMHDELQRCDRLGIPYYVIHPGSHMGRGAADGIKRIAETINQVYDSGYNCMTLLEMVSGHGNHIGSSADEMLAVIDASQHRGKLGICLDSCHIFSAGYNIRDDYNRVMDELCGAFGSLIKVFHLNDSKMPLAGRKDRHELIGKGEISADFFKKVVNDRRFNDILGILETPVQNNYADEINILKSYRGEQIWK
jgi:deoxyribonuclease-4